MYMVCDADLIFQERMRQVALRRAFTLQSTTSSAATTTASMRGWCTWPTTTSLQVWQNGWAAVRHQADSVCLDVRAASGGWHGLGTACLTNALDRD